jgi:hypothetical protein
MRLPFHLNAEAPLYKRWPITDPRTGGYPYLTVFIWKDDPMKLRVILESGEEGRYTVTVPPLSGCLSEGREFTFLSFL